MMMFSDFFDSNVGNYVGSDVDDDDVGDVIHAI
jgi:hypothetical protein